MSAATNFQSCQVASPWGSLFVGGNLQSSRHMLLACWRWILEAVRLVLTEGTSCDNHVRVFELERPLNHCVSKLCRDSDRCYVFLSANRGASFSDTTAPWVARVLAYCGIRCFSNEVVIGALAQHCKHETELCCWTIWPRGAPKSPAVDSCRKCSGSTLLGYKTSGSSIQLFCNNAVRHARMRWDSSVRLGANPSRSLHNLPSL